MHTWITFLTFIGVTFCSFANLDGLILVQETSLDSSIVDQSLKSNECVYHFAFKGVYNDGLKHKIHYSIDGTNKSVNLVASAILTIATTPGKHIFQFYYNSDYYEVYTDSLTIEAKHRDYWSLNFRTSKFQEVSEKPVIYLYPEITTKVHVVMGIKGSNAFMYPAYNDCWEFTAHPNGDLTIGENTYNYLFWEARSSDQIIVDQGFVVARENSTAFLEEKLTEIGLNSKEQADFITYWAPRMTKNDHNFVQFVFNEDCDRYATMDITPKPDHIYRVYMKWTSINEGFEVEPQELPKMDRTGFTVLEWGGQESHFRRINCMAHKDI
jgi:hypothetical protein